MHAAAKGPPRRRGRPVDAGLRARREAQILEAAAHAFAEHGYAGLDVEALAAGIGVGKGTVYRYFPTKEALFLAAQDRLMRVLADDVARETDGAADPLDRLARAVHGYLGHFDAHPEHVELIILERAVFRDRRPSTYSRHRDDNLKPWEDLIRGLVADGTFRDVPVARIVDVLSAALYGAIFTSYFTGRPRGFRAQADDLLDVVLRGVRAAPAAARRGRRG